MQLIEKLIIDQCQEIRNYLSSTQTHSTYRPQMDALGNIWRNPDNMLFGSLGEKFFSIEMFSITREQHILDEILSDIDSLEKHCLNQPTNNYSLFVGRLGIGRLYLELFFKTNGPSFLKRASSLLEQYLNDHRKHLHFFDNSSLVDGSSSILLFCIAIFRETRSELVMSAIRRYTENLLGEAVVTEEGVHWNGITNISRRHYGYSYGNAGIAMVLLQLGCLFNSEFFFRLASHALNHEYASRPDWQSNRNVLANGNGSEYSLATGSSGSELIRTAYQSLGLSQSPPAYFEQLTRMVNDPLSIDSFGWEKINISSGIAGCGIVINAAYAFTGEQKHLDLSEQITTKLLQCLDNQTLDWSQNTCLQNGISGIGYYLLKCLNRTEETVFFPMNALLRFPSTTFSDLEFKASPSFVPDFEEWLTKKKYPKTLRYLATHLRPDQGLPNLEKSPSLVFEVALESILPLGRVTEVREILDREKTLLSFISIVSDTYFPVEAHFFEKVELLKSDKNIFERTILQKNPFIKTIDHEAIKLNVKEPLRPAEFIKLLTGYGLNSYYFQINKFNLVEENRLQLLKIFSDHFEVPTTVYNAIVRIIDFFISHNKKNIQILKLIVGVKNDTELYWFLYNEAIKGIKTLFMSNYLVTNKAIQSMIGASIVKNEQF